MSSQKSRKDVLTRNPGISLGVVIGISITLIPILFIHRRDLFAAFVEHYTTDKETLAVWLASGMAVVSAVISGFALFYLRKTWQEARRATELTQDMARHSEQSFRRMERPLVVPKFMFAPNDLVFDSGSSGLWDVHYETSLRITNIGRTPAIVTKIKLRRGFFLYGQSKPDLELDETKAREFILEPNGGSDELNLKIIAEYVTESTVDGYFAGEIESWIVGSLEYFDLLGTRFERIFFVTFHTKEIPKELGGPEFNYEVYPHGQTHDEIEAST